MGKREKGLKLGVKKSNRPNFASRIASLREDYGDGWSLILYLITHPPFAEVASIAQQEIDSDGTCRVQLLDEHGQVIEEWTRQGKYNHLSGPVSTHTMVEHDIRSLNFYKIIVESLELGDLSPEGIFINKQGEIYLPLSEIAQLMNLSPERVRGLVAEQRLDAIKPSGHDLFVSLVSASMFTRKSPGRPRKTIPSSVAT